MLNYDAPWTDHRWTALTERLLDSFEFWLRRPLIDRSGSRVDQARNVFEATFVLLAHDCQPDPVFCYANQTALTLWEQSLENMLRMPSRESAELQQQPTRSHMLQQGLEQGYLMGYEGVRVSASGKRFRVKNATIFNVVDAQGHRIGQAATFAEWQFVDP